MLRQPHTFVLSAAILLAFAGCAAGQDVADEPASGTEGAGASGGAGGAGGAPQCAGDAECDDTEPCTTDSCTDGACVNAPVEDGPLGDQRDGDCSVVQCNDGVSQPTIDDTDLPDDDNDCTANACNRGVPSHPAEPVGTECISNGGVMCNGDDDAPACVECNAPGNCTALPTDNGCRTRTCVMGVCGQTFEAAGTPTAVQTAGDCKVAVCDGAGNIVDDNDDTDVPVDGNDCTADVCLNGAPSNPFEAVDTPCGNPPSLYCDGAGACVGCNTPAQCAPALTCQTATCINGMCGVANLPNGSVCDDNQYCNGTDHCVFGSCAIHDGDPCAANVGDADDDCSESCDEAADSCSAQDPTGSSCSDGLFCTATDTCNAMGVCTSSSNPCPGHNVGPQCNDSCNEATDQCNANDPDGTSCGGGGVVCSNGTCPCSQTVPGFNGQLGPNFTSQCWRQCEGYLDNVNVDDIPAAWGDNCVDPAFNKIRIVCGVSASTYRYIDVNKNVFKDGLISYPESGLITTAQDQNGVPFAFQNDIYATGNHPHVQQSWWAGGQGCGETNTNLTVNNICSFDASNCFGQNIAGSRFLYVYVKE